MWAWHWSRAKPASVSTTARRFRSVELAGVGQTAASYQAGKSRQNEGTRLVAYQLRRAKGGRDLSQIETAAIAVGGIARRH